MVDSSKYYKKIIKEKIDCPICDASNYSLLLKEDRYNMGVETVICNQCSLIYINPRPTESEMSDFYKLDYRKFYESIEVPTEEYIKNGPFFKRASFVLNSLKCFLNDAKTFIDIGCAEGSLIKMVEDNYSKIKTYGIEPSVGFGNFAKENVNGDIFIGTYQNFIKENTEEKFDILATTHVLEHILNPNEYLKALGSLMHEQSILYIEVPNIMDKRMKGIGNVHLGHVLSYDPRTIKILLENSGFEIIDIFTKELPALTPAMAVICKSKSCHDFVDYPSKKDIHEKALLFVKNIKNLESGIKQKKNFKTTLSIFRKKIFD